MAPSAFARPRVNDYGKYSNFLNCSSSKAIPDETWKLGRIVEKASKCWETELFLSISEFHFHFEQGEN